MSGKNEDRSGDWKGEGFLINAAYWSGIIPLAVLVLIPALFWPMIEYFAVGVPETLGGAALKQMAWLVFASIAASVAFAVFAVVWIVGKVLRRLVSLAQR
jgi:hypothetical protein